MKQKKVMLLNKLEEGKVVVKVDSKFYLPTEVDLLIGDYYND